MDWAVAHSYAAADVHVAMGCDKKIFTYTSVAVTPVPIRVCTQQQLILSFTSVVG